MLDLFQKELSCVFIRFSIAINRQFLKADAVNN